MTLRIAMWSGPRNISTALMRSWGNRGDTAVCDEPLYAHYLKVTGRDHPGAADIIASCEADWRKVAASLTEDAPEEKVVYYQKQMAHHLLPNIDRGWLGSLTNCFLIREPQEMLTSLMKIVPDLGVEDTGLPQQVEIFEWVEQRTGAIPPVLDSRDVLENPKRLLGLLCDALGVEFTDAMLSWPPGPRATDGVWAPHWYSEVEGSTGFRAYTPKNEAVPDHLREVHEECVGYYQKLYRHRLGE